MTHTAHTILANADRKAAKLLQGASAPTAHKSLQGGVSKHARKRAAPVRREHTSEDVFPIPDIPPAQSRLKSWATDPAISVNAGVPMDQDERPLAGPSRPTPKPPFFKSRINEPDYDFPSSTPTPPAKPRTAQYWDGASSSSSTSLSRSSSSPFPPPWLHHDRSSRRNSVNLPVLGQDHEVSESSILQDSYDVYMMNNEPTVEPEPQEPEPEVRPVPYISPSALPTSSMLPPPVPALVRVPRPDPPPSTGFAAPSLTPIPPSLSRPFVPPSQVPSGSQLERPRASQRPKVLGMRPMYPQSSKFQSKPKPFKVPFAKKPSGSSGSGSGSTSGSGAGQAGGRSMSPVIPDPPYVAARVAALDEPGLEMTARRPEPARMDEDEDEGPKDANSSADMWAALDAIE
ncbi:hypothetical protein C8T65DRAFT_281485 [Cerioporus squamosus]|nr:hypothetical protein C8T65DRAFT_281485 [Cerioporus squamosus]